ncbi:hypothetical protein N5D67_14025 [Comamonas aquatica]|uniref:hypothetical protein n=1 Tax=Comamonas aquatica TaxID=225991 RepID=UPI002447B3AE|nr:hypothetical protein [Comamonas aquatica]MDH1903417.1 hypothetical protein [Comamonas aquatica]
MTSYVKPARLHVRRWLLAAFLGATALNAHAIDQIYNWNGLEFVRSGNAHHVHPASPESTRLRGGWVLDISDVEPKVTGKHDLPYQHKGGALAKVNVATKINKAAIASKAADVVKDAAKKAGSNPYLTVAAIGCSLVCDALVSWGVDQLKTASDGTFSALVPDPSATVENSDGRLYRVKDVSPHYSYGISKSAACEAARQYLSTYGNNVQWKTWTATIVGTSTCKITQSGGPYNNGISWDHAISDYGLSSCPIGSSIVNGVCNGQATIEKPLPRVFEDNIVNKPWGPVQASVVKALIQNGHNVFTDGTDTTITGPDSVPLNTSKTSWPVNVLPGTTTPAPAGHTGATDSGTQTTTTTTTAKNTFSPSGSSSGGSGSSGGPASLGSMTTTQQTTTTTTVTNNITNNTSTTVINNVTETDEAPKEPEKDPCEKNPDSLACAELDTPEGEIPETEIQLNYEYESLFGNGSCPATDTVPLFGQQVHVVDMPKICSQVQNYMQPFVLLSAALIAMAIFAGGVRA